MGFRYQKRIDLGEGTGLNISKSGISPSVRTKFGSIGPKGFSIRTGIPGFSYRGGKNKDVAAIALVYFGAVVVWNIFLFISWLGQEAYHFVLRKKLGA